jgi:hypothetical protein
MNVLTICVLVWPLTAAGDSLSPATESGIAYSPWNTEENEEVIEAIPEGNHRDRALMSAPKRPMSDVLDKANMYVVTPHASPWMERHGVKPWWVRGEVGPDLLSAAKTELAAFVTPDFIPPDPVRSVTTTLVARDAAGPEGPDTQRSLYLSFRMKYPHGADRECAFMVRFKGRSLDLIHGFVDGWPPSKMRSAEQVMEAVRELLGPQPFVAIPPMPIERIIAIAHKDGLKLTDEQITADYPRTFCFRVPERGLYVRAGRTILNNAKTGEREVGAVAFWVYPSKATSRPAR